MGRLQVKSYDMKRVIVPLLLLSLLNFVTHAQRKSIQELAPASDHYEEFKRLSGKPNPVRAWMDTIQYPPKEYGNSITFLLVRPYYLSQDQLKILSESVAYPANSSDQVKKELEYLLDLQATRTSEQVKRVEFLSNIGYWPQTNLLTSHPNYHQNLEDLFFEGREIYGVACSAKNFPLVSTLLEGIMQDMRVMEFTIKYKLLRPRPYHLESNLKPLTKINSPSFTSGHTLWAFLQAFVWSEIIPEKKTDFITLAEEIRRSREIMGIHYPSDNEASRLVAYKMLLSFMENKSFQNDFHAAVAEWKRNSKKYFP